MSNQHAREMMLRILIDDQKAQSFTDPETISDARALGVLVARVFDWSGGDILECLISALEEANFHEDAEKISTLVCE